MSQRRDPLLPRAVLVFLAVIVALGWLATVVAALRDPANSSSLLVVTGLLATVIGTSFGVLPSRSQSNTEENKPGDDTP